MTTKDGKSGRGTDARAARLAAALRENLKRRKGQARARSAEAHRADNGEPHAGGKDETAKSED